MTGTRYSLMVTELTCQLAHVIGLVLTGHLSLLASCQTDVDVE